jgi:RNA polymerase primary sigma factor
VIEPSEEPVTQATKWNDPLMRLYLAEAGETPLLSPSEEHELGLLNQRGNEEARQHLIKSNLRLVVTIAKEFTNRGLDFLDLIQLGNIGLMTAVERFDPNREAKLSTYASWWIKQSIRKGLANQSRTIRIPIFRTPQMQSICEAQNTLFATLQREPSEKELAVQTGFAEDKIRDCLDAMRLRSTIALETPLDSDSSDHRIGSLHDTTADPNIEPPSNGMILSEQRVLIRAILGDRDSLKSIPKALQKIVLNHPKPLSPREIDIIKRRFGLDTSNDASKTLDQLGKEYGVTRERIRQIEARALDKLLAIFTLVDAPRNRLIEAIGTKEQSESDQNQSPT